MKTNNLQPYTFIKTDQKFIADTFPLYTLCLGLGMYATYYFVVFVFLSDQSLAFDRTVWLGTYVTPYIFHFWILAASFILAFLFFRDYQMGFRQIKLEPNQITLYPKQKTKELQIHSWEHPIQSIFLSKKNTLLEVDLESRSLILPANIYSSKILKITQFYDAQVVNDERNHQSESQDED
jgi:hypothetical protein